MELRRFPRDCALDLRLTVRANLFGTTHVIVTVRLPALGGVEVRGSLPESSRLRARVRWEVALAVVPHHESDALIVVRAGFLDATTGDTPIVWTSHPPRPARGCE